MTKHLVTNLIQEKGEVIYMVKPEWGVKRVCQKCSTRFYDMLHQPIICPQCKTTFDPESFSKKRRGRPSVSENTVSPLPVEPGETLDFDIPETFASFDENDEILEDTSDFGEEENVVGIEKTSEEI